MERRRFMRAAAAALVAPLGQWAAHAQTWPDKPVRLLVPTPPGNALDISARLLGDRLAQRWKQAVVVDNRPGGSGLPAMIAGKTAAPDGYTIIVAPSSTMAINPGLYPKLPYDPRENFDTVGGIYLAPIMLVAGNASPYHSLADVVAAARKEPGKLAIAIGGPPGTTQHLSAELFRFRAGLQVINVPYKGSGPAMQDLLGGQVGLLFDSVASALPQIKAGALRPIAVASAQRMPQLPNVPTIAESGYPGFEAVSWGGLAVPRGTPQAVIDRIGEDTRAIVNDPAVREQMLSRGLLPDPRGAADWSRFIDSEIVKWGELIKSAHITVE
ncbi:Bug family tripartite tricarboxylate transporter substrate binding protein [Cupriavidus sp. 30B13]|uniref:Bug family tripartite tricarboxylate transporter substrate binding protein n=1 Tax=Cupriavidus sp. 30B13 TaxID=3384241 RepID=UPI003B91218A